MVIGSVDIERRHSEIADLGKTDQNPDFGQNPYFFIVLSALNHCKRSQRGLRFLWDVLWVFYDIIRIIVFEK